MRVIRDNDAVYDSIRPTGLLTSKIVNDLNNIGATYPREQQFVIESSLLTHGRYIQSKFHYMKQADQEKIILANAIAKFLEKYDDFAVAYDGNVANFVEVTIRLPLNTDIKTLVDPSLIKETGMLESLFSAPDEA